MKKHRFRFTKESLEKMEQFGKRIFSGEKAEPQVAPAPLAPVQETPAAAPVTEEEAPEEILEPFCVASKTDIGLVRSTNQDAVIQGDHLLGVADGMGGHQGGETASAAARDGLLTLLENKKPEANELLEAIKSVNRKIFLQAAEEPTLSGMGTTVTVLWFDEDCVYVGHVGDSRCYRLRDGELTQITDDHSVVADMMRAGILTPSQASTHPMKNVITRAVGTERTVQVDMQAIPRQYGDKWLVCSDGLHGMVSDEQIKIILRDFAPEQAAECLIQAAIAAGGRDNVTVVVVEDREVAE